MEDEKKSEILRLNKEQARFYDAPSERRFNPVMNMWRFLRRRMYFLMNNTRVWDDVYSLQKEWMGDLAGKKVLDFGCYDGNALSAYLAGNAASYLGIDLSERDLGSLRDSFEKRGIQNARLQCVDVLSNEFRESGFDVICAQGVLQQFQRWTPQNRRIPLMAGVFSPQTCKTLLYIWKKCRKILIFSTFHTFYA